MYLALLVRRLPNTCARRVRSASRDTGSRGSETRELVPSSSMSGRAVSTALSPRRPAARAERRELHLVPADAGDVEQVVDQPDHVRELPVHHGTGLGDGVLVPRQPHHLEAVAQGRQRVPQLVGEQRRNSSFLRPASLSSSSARFRSVTSVVAPIIRTGRPAVSRITVAAV